MGDNEVVTVVESPPPRASAPRCCSGPCPHTPSKVENALNAVWCKPGECQRTDCDNFCERAWEAALNAR